VECDSILEQLENIDDEADEFGINFVKNKDPHAARQTNYFQLILLSFDPLFVVVLILETFTKTSAW
jgi:hypothetical protein